jgi:hypothetical protein
MKSRWKLVALLATLGVVAGAVCLAVGSDDDKSRDDDAFTAKYRLIRKGTTYEEAAELLGPSDDEFHLVMSPGDHIYDWNSPDGLRTIEATWDALGDLREKSLASKDGKVILSETFGWRFGSRRLRPRPWWERLLTRVGLR